MIQAGSIAYMRTGQVTCHDVSGTMIPCAGSGQDAEWRKGVPWPEPRFESEGATVRDRLTGLVWTRDANPTEFPLTWPEALAFIARMNREGALGFADWRLPNRVELRSLVSHQTRKPALPREHPFENVVQSWYWSATTAAISPANAWYVNMEGGRMFYGGKEQFFLAWPVRGTGNGVLRATGETRCYDAAGTEVACPGVAAKTGRFGRGGSGRHRASRCAATPSSTGSRGWSGARRPPIRADRSPGGTPSPPSHASTPRRTATGTCPTSTSLNP